MAHQISLKITTGDKVFFMRDNKVQSGIVSQIRITLCHIPGDQDKTTECKVITDVCITVDAAYPNRKSIPDAGFSRRIEQVFTTKEELIQELLK